MEQTPPTHQQTQTTAYQLRELLFKYLAYLPLFILSVVISVGVGYIYIKYTVPIYNASTLLLIKPGEDNTISQTPGNDPVSIALTGGRKVNLDNEIEQLRSYPVIERVVKAGQFNLRYFTKGKINRYEIDKAGGFRLLPLQIADSSHAYSFTIPEYTLTGGEITWGGPDQDAHRQAFRWNDTLTLEGMRFVLVPNPGLTDNTIPYTIVWEPIPQAIAEIQGDLSITIPNPKTTTLQLNIKVENRFRGQEILNTLIEQYKIVDIDDKNRVARNSIAFIDQRLNIVQQELTQLELDIKNYKERNHISDLGIMSQQYAATTKAFQDAIDGLQTKLNMAAMVNDYISRPENNHKLIPSSMGIDDPTFMALVANYNEVQLKKDKNAPYITPGGMISGDFENQLAQTRKSMLISLANYQKALREQLANQQKNLAVSDALLFSIPEKERELMDINRQKSIKESLYLYLLQKREEAAISSSSTVSNYQQLTPAVSSPVPVEPRTNNIRMFSLLLGIVLPFGIIFLIDLLNDKVTTREDIVHRIDKPIVGEISHAGLAGRHIIVTSSRNVIAEQFRILRTNMEFQVKGQAKPVTYLVTSSVSGEGKSFVSLNLAAVLSLSTKKVALLEFDLRKLRKEVYEGEQQNPKGITNCLIGQVQNPAEAITTIDSLPNLHIFRSGPIPPNPAELVIGEQVVAFMQWVKERYDYIIIDSAPVGLVSDTYAFTAYADSVIYLIRQRFTYKKQVDFFADLVAQNKLPNACIVVNDVQLGGRYGYYGYGYGYGGYGYMYRYGLYSKRGYGYGYYGKTDQEGYFDPPDKS
ncbi:GumC family protein [Hydrotalea sp.]|uniref:GumC family protein n=1 Tax=Hydrotalea sp. TaxID=2881279 RepID=UPI003D0EF856